MRILMVLTSHDQLGNTGRSDPSSSEAGWCGKSGRVSSLH